MEFRQLRYFTAAAELQNIAQAAEKLNVSQPPVSRQIRALEHELGVALFNRTTRGVELTDAGERFLVDARRLLSDAEAARTSAQAASRGEIGSLNVAFFGSAIYRAVPLALAALKEVQPRVSVTLSRMEKAHQIESLRRGQIDLGFGRYYGSDAGIQVETLAREPFLVALSVHDPAADADCLTPAELVGRSLFLFPREGRPNFADHVVTMLSDQEVALDVAGEAEDATSALTLVVHETSRCLVPASVAALRFPGIRFVPLVGTDATVPVNYIFRKSDPNPALKIFLDILANTVAKDDWYTPEV
ncbi:LysR family transcriptional regulator [uncultured Ruegeria sp.]|uniref:LysR family transcriptional regulator n=1 Tax=uncultured Ruegeria sp. TaxID=259304 RepID=UPI0026193141|nr:LysR family transcriptional regulator [uncultured Ruegeria sp.]